MASVEIESGQWASGTIQQTACVKTGGIGVNFIAEKLLNFLEPFYFGFRIWELRIDG